MITLVSNRIGRLRQEEAAGAASYLVRHTRWRRWRRRQGKKCRSLAAVAEAKEGIRPSKEAWSKYADRPTDRPNQPIGWYSAPRPGNRLSLKNCYSRPNDDDEDDDAIASVTSWSVSWTPLPRRRRHFRSSIKKRDMYASVSAAFLFLGCCSSRLRKNGRQLC